MATEINKSPPPGIDFESMTWKCPCCGQERKDRYIKVAIHDFSSTIGFPPGTMGVNCKYCVDNPLCVQRAHDRAWVQNHFLKSTINDDPHRQLKIEDGMVKEVL